MKSLPFLLLIIVPLASFSQTQKDCIQVMDKFVRYFNSEQLDSLNSLFPKSAWGRETFNDSRNDMGNIISYHFMIIDSTDLDVGGNPMAYFAVETSNKVWDSKINAMGIALTKDKNIYGCRILTKSKHTDDMLQEHYYSH